MGISTKAIRALILLGLLTASISQSAYAKSTGPALAAEGQSSEAAQEAPIEAAKVNGTLEPGDLCWELVRRRIPNINYLGGPNETYHYQYYLRIKGQSEVLPLARGNRAINGQEYGFVNNGLDEKTFEVSWVREGDLVHVFWKTYASGQGGFYVATELLLLKNVKGWRELFRNSHSFAVSMGGGEYHKTEEEYSWNKDSSELTVRRSDRHENGSEDPLPLGVKIPEGRWYQRKATVITEWRYRIEGQHLHYIDGQRLIDPGEGTFNLTEIAKYLDEKADPAPLVARMRKRNPSLEKSDEVIGRILVETGIPALVPDTKQHYYGGE